MMLVRKSLEPMDADTSAQLAAETEVARMEFDTKGDLLARRLDISNRTLEEDWDTQYAALDESSRQIVDAELERLIRVHGARGLTKWQAALTAKDPASALHKYIWRGAVIPAETPAENPATGIATVPLGRPPGRHWTKKKWFDEYRKADAELAKHDIRATDEDRATAMGLAIGTFRDYKNGRRLKDGGRSGGYGVP